MENPHKKESSNETSDCGERPCQCHTAWASPIKFGTIPAIAWQLHKARWEHLACLDLKMKSYVFLLSSLQSEPKAVFTPEVGQAEFSPLHHVPLNQWSKFRTSSAALQHGPINIKQSQHRPQQLIIPKHVTTRNIVISLFLLWSSCHRRFNIENSAKSTCKYKTSRGLVEQRLQSSELLI